MSRSYDERHPWERLYSWVPKRIWIIRAQLNTTRAWWMYRPLYNHLWHPLRHRGRVWFSERGDGIVWWWLQ